MWNCGTGVKGIIVRVCKSVFCFVVQCQHSMGSGSVFPSVEQCFSVWSSVWSTFPGSPGKIGCRARPVPPPLRYSAPLFLSHQLFSSLWVLWYTLYKTSPVFAFKVHTGQVWVFWDQSINGQCRRRGHLRRRWPEAESHRGTLGPPGASKVTAELCCASKCPYCCVFKTEKWNAVFQAMFVLVGFD